MGFNFDDAMRFRTEAARTGIGKKEWIEFAHMMFDEFPSLYETARKMTIHQDELATDRNKYKDQRDELLEALKGIQEMMGYEWLRPEFNQARDAIAKATA